MRDHWWRVKVRSSMEGEGDGLRSERWRVRQGLRLEMEGEGDGLRSERWRVTVEIRDGG